MRPRDTLLRKRKKSTLTLSVSSACFASLSHGSALSTSLCSLRSRSDSSAAVLSTPSREWISSLTRW